MMGLLDTQIENSVDPTRWQADDPRVHQVIQSAQLELQNLLQQRDQIIKRIGTMKQTIVGLAKLFGNDVFTEEVQVLLGRKSGARSEGLTNTCRIVLMESERPLSAREVCEHLERRLPLLVSRHKDPLASVTTVLNRLAQYGEARTVLQADGRRAWEWASEAQERLRRRSARTPRQGSTSSFHSLTESGQEFAK
jgi:hypothetical protein